MALVATMRQQQAQMEEAAVAQQLRQQQLEAALAESQAQVAEQAVSTRAASSASDARAEQMEQQSSSLQLQVMELRALLDTATSERDQLQGAMQGTLDFYQAACQQRDQAISERDSAFSERDQAKAAEQLLQGVVKAMAVENGELRQQAVQRREEEEARVQQEQQRWDRVFRSDFPGVPLENEACMAIVGELGRGAFGAVKHVQSEERAVKHFIVRGPPLRLAPASCHSIPALPSFPAATDSSLPACLPALLPPLSLQPCTDPCLTESEKANIDAQGQFALYNEARFQASLQHANIMPITSMVYKDQPSGERSFVGFSMPVVDGSLADQILSFK